MRLVAPLPGKVPDAERREAWATPTLAPPTSKERDLRAVDPDEQTPGRPHHSPPVLADSRRHLASTTLCVPYDFGRASAVTTHSPSLGE